MITHKTFSWVNRWIHMFYKNIIIRWCLHLSSYVHSYQTTTNNIQSRGYLCHNVNHGLSSNEFLHQTIQNTHPLASCLFLYHRTVHLVYISPLRKLLMDQPPIGKLLRNKRFSFNSHPRKFVPQRLNLFLRNLQVKILGRKSNLKK